MKNLKKIFDLDKLSTLLLYTSIFTFIIAFNFAHNPPSGWYQQFLPNLSNFQISDMFFLDSLTGWTITGNSMPNDTSGYILKTTNGGDNWQLKYTDFRDFSRVKFLNSNTGFVSGGYATGARIYKSTDGGESWFAIGIPGGGQIYFDDMSVLNEDTIWVVARNSFVGGVFRTTNGGSNWIQQYSSGDNPNKIYMFNSRIGFIANNEFDISTKKTTDGGFNWFTVLNEGFTDIYFLDSLTGWKCNIFSIKKTTNGGENWITQVFPSGNNLLNGMRSISSVSKDTIWGVGGIKQYGIMNRGMSYRTTNSGNTWHYQVPDTSIHIMRYDYVNFINAFIGWGYGLTTGVHTVTGGDSIFYPITNINQISSEIPSDFKLNQNYPNPFNPTTTIVFKVKSSKIIKLIIHDISGKEIAVLIHKKLNAGEYSYVYDASSLSSGVYFYSLIIEGDKVETKKMILIR